MWLVYLLTFFGGSIMGTIIMGLCAVSREPEPHEVHVYVDTDGEMEIMTIPPGDQIIWHRATEDMGA